MCVCNMDIASCWDQLSLQVSTCLCHTSATSNNPVFHDSACTDAKTAQNANMAGKLHLWLQCPCRPCTMISTFYTAARYPRLKVWKVKRVQVSNISCSLSPIGLDQAVTALICGASETPLKQGAPWTRQTPQKMSHRWQAWLLVAPLPLTCMTDQIRMRQAQNRLQAGQ